MMHQVLLIEDDEAVRDGMELVLRRRGYGVRIAANGADALSLLGSEEGQEVELAVLDLMLPDMDGFEVCRRLRQSSDIPVIMLTARGEDDDIVEGLEAGADDYIIKPVTSQVLEARIRAALRRSEVAAPGTGGPESHGTLCIDRTSLTITKDGHPISLPPVELRLLLEMSSSPRQVFSRDQLLELVWDHSYLGDSRLVDAAIGRLRAKIEDSAREPRFIQTVRGFGYRFGPT